MRLIDADAIAERVRWRIVENPHKDARARMFHQTEHESFLSLIGSMPTIAPPPNAPLTLEELRKMDGEPVWVQPPGIPECGSWRIVAGVDTEDGEQTLYCNGDYTCRDYGAVWLAYRRKPEEGMT